MLFLRSDPRHSSLELYSEHLDIDPNDADVTVFDPVNESLELDEDMIVMEINDHKRPRLSSVSVNSSNSDSDSASDDEKEKNLQDCDWFFVPLAVNQADEVCIKLDELIKRGLIPRDRIMYKYLRDTIHCLIDPNHQYNPEVVEFFNTIEHLGGESTVNFITGPMYHGTGKGGVKKPEDAKPNLGGPSKPTRQKMKGGYTNASGVLKDMHLGFLTFVTGGPTELVPIYNTPKAKVIGAAMQNDGTALQPGILFDEALKCNVGLTPKIDIQFVKKNPSPSPEFLNENVITEANVSFLTTLCDSVSMPVAVEYLTKTGKSGQDMLNMFAKQIDALQSCKACLEKTSSVELISQCNKTICNKKCETCRERKQVCDECSKNGQVSYSPALRACNHCLENNIQCVHLAILAFSSDCEEGNKKAMKLLEQLQRDGLVDPQLELCVYLPDAVHVGKSCKCSFSNWFCLFDNSRLSLAVVHTLREDSDFAIKSQLRKLLTKEEVQNKDRMAVEPITRLCSPVLKVLSSTKSVVHTLIPDKFRPIDSNKDGLYPHPIFICLGPNGKFFFMDYSPLKKETKLCLADLHNPVRVSVVKSGLSDAKSMLYLNGKGVALVVEQGKKTVTVVEEERKITLKPSNLKTKKSLQDALQCRGLPHQGIIPELRERRQTSLAQLREDYEKSGKVSTAVNMDKKVTADSICPVSDDMIAMASNSDSCLYLVELTLDGVGITGAVKEFSRYPSDCKSVYAMFISSRTLVISYDKGIAKIDMATREQTVVLSNGTPSYKEVRGIAPFEDQGDTVFTDMGSRQIKKVSSNGTVEIIAGSVEEGNNDGTRASFSQPMGI